MYQLGENIAANTMPFYHLWLFSLLLFRQLTDKHTHVSHHMHSCGLFSITFPFPESIFSTQELVHSQVSSINFCTAPVNNDASFEFQLLSCLHICVCSQRKLFFAKHSRTTFRFSQAENVETFPSSKTGHLPYAPQPPPPPAPSVWFAAPQHNISTSSLTSASNTPPPPTWFSIRPSSSDLPQLEKKTSIAHFWKLQGPPCRLVPVSAPRTTPHLCCCRTNLLAFPLCIVSLGPLLSRQNKGGKQGGAGGREEEEAGGGGGGRRKNVVVEGAV